VTLDIMKKKVLVGLSGGVDSSVSAYLLKKQGYEVISAFILISPPMLQDFFKQKKTITCPWSLDLRLARQVASQLNIPFYIFDFSRNYEKVVLKNFISEYKKGSTPNPDVLCNQAIKFGQFLRIAQKVGADYVATGHYAGKLKNCITRGKDKSKDQSYFLWKLDKNQIQKAIFPLSKLHKSEVRKIASQAKLPTASRPDSQGICFLGQIKVQDFLSHQLKNKPGRIINNKNEILGEHQGLWRYTIGQKIAGLRFTGTSYAGKDIPLLYATRKNLLKNYLLVGPLASPELYSRQIAINQTNFGKFNPSQQTLCQIRYGQAPQKCQVKMQKNSVVVVFEKQQRAVTIGQSLVVYQGDTLVGGGIIKSII